LGGGLKMQLSIVNYSTVKISSNEFRIDPEYYKPDYINLDKKLENTKLCSEYIEFLTDGTHQTPSYKSKGIPFLSSGNVHPCYLQFKNTKYISTEEHDSLKHCQPNHGDILISKSGRIGHAAVVPIEYKKGAFNIYEGIALLRVKNYSPYALALLLNSKILQDQIKRLQKGVAQPHLHLEDIRILKIPNFSEQFIELLETAYKEIEAMSSISRLEYGQAQTLLLSELGLINWQPKHQLTFVKQYSEANQAGRLDSEYYQPKYDELIQTINNNSEYVKKISEISTYNTRGLQPKYSANDTLSVITSKHILDDGLDFDNFMKTAASNWDSQRKARIKKGDILTYTTGANIGRTAFYPLDAKALASNHVNILRVKDENAEYVCFVMNSLVGRLQTEQMSAGSAQAELYPKDIDEFSIPFIAEKFQKLILNKVSKSHDLRDQSKHLFECAKQAVEMAINQDEQHAITWIADIIKKYNK
jgi:restriction endonuclease S subunit